MTQEVYFLRQNRDRPSTALTPANEDAITAAVERQCIARELGLSKATVSEMLLKEMLYPLYYSQSPHSFPEDRHVRIQFRERLRHEHARNEIFFDHKSLSEARFTPDGALGININRIRTRKNPHVVRLLSYQIESGSVSGQIFSGRLS